MYYEPYKKKPRRRRGCFFRILQLLLVVLIVYAVALVASSGYFPFNLGGGDLAVNRDLPRGWTNVLLLGSDVDSSGGSRSDSMMVLSIGPKGQIKLTSILRDTMVEIEGHGQHKINAAYRFGGPELAMKTVNQAFSLDVTRYALIDYQGFGALVDALGGVEVDVTEAERKAVNQSVHPINGEPKEGLKLKASGKNTHLNGAQALAFSRIRKLDSDYQRAQRQRMVISAILQKLRATKNPVALIHFAQAGLKSVQTNINFVELTALGAKVLMAGAQMETYRVPADGTYQSGTRDGVWAIRPDFDANRALIYDFIYQ